MKIKQFLLILGLSVSMLSGCKSKEAVPELAIEQSCDKLVEITKDCFAPATEEQYKESYLANKGYFAEGEADKFYSSGTKSVVTGIQTVNVDVVFSSKNDSNDCVYRVTMDLVGETGSTNIDAYYYINSDNKISKVIVMGGGNGRV